jgi:hypothetical protein
MSPDEVQTCNYYSEPLHGNPSFVSPVGDEQMGTPKVIKSLLEGSSKDVGTNRSKTGGASNPKYQPNACRLGNEALDRVEVAGPRRTEQSHINFPFFEPCLDLVGKVSSQGERDSSVRKPEDVQFGSNNMFHKQKKADIFIKGWEVRTFTDLSAQQATVAKENPIRKRLVVR